MNQPIHRIGDTVRVQINTKMIDREIKVATDAHIVGIKLDYMNGGTAIYMYTLQLDPIPYSNYLGQSFNRSEKEL